MRENFPHKILQSSEQVQQLKSFVHALPPELTHCLAELLHADHADQLEGAAGVAEPLHHHLAGLAGPLLKSLLKYN